MDEATVHDLLEEIQKRHVYQVEENIRLKENIRELNKTIEEQNAILNLADKSQVSHFKNIIASREARIRELIREVEALRPC
jgi:hypothetical protein